MNGARKVRIVLHPLFLTLTLSLVLFALLSVVTGVFPFYQFRGIHFWETFPTVTVAVRAHVFEVIEIFNRSFSTFQMQLYGTALMTQAVINSAFFPSLDLNLPGCFSSEPVAYGIFLWYVQVYCNLADLIQSISHMEGRRTSLVRVSFPDTRWRWLFDTNF